MSVNKALDSVLANNLDEMRNHFSNTLSTKAVEKLEERKAVIAQNYFGQVNEESEQVDEAASRKRMKRELTAAGQREADSRDGFGDDDYAEKSERNLNRIEKKYGSRGLDAVERRAQRLLYGKRVKKG